MYSTYLPPNKELNKENITSLIEDTTPTIICGDLNAKHEDWNSRTKNTNEIKLKTRTHIFA